MFEDQNIVIKDHRHDVYLLFLETLTRELEGSVMAPKGESMTCLGPAALTVTPIVSVGDRLVLTVSVAFKVV